MPLRDVYSTEVKGIARSRERDVSDGMKAGCDIVARPSLSNKRTTRTSACMATIDLEAGAMKASAVNINNRQQHRSTVYCRRFCRPQHTDNTYSILITQRQRRSAEHLPTITYMKTMLAFHPIFVTILIIGS